MKTNARLALAALVAALALPASVGAAPLLLGNTVRVTYEFPVLGVLYAGPSDVVVGAGVELPFFAGFADVDLTDNQIIITAGRNAGINNVAFDGFHFNDILGSIPPFTSVVLDPATNYGGLDASRLTFNPENIYLNLVGLPGLTGQRVVIDINPSSTAPVPEPSTFALLGASLIAGARKLRSRSR
jgi:hypothetical protein